MSPTRKDPPSSDLARRGEAGGQHQPVRRPDHDQPVEQRLDDVGLEDQGDVLEDDLRDRRGSGVPPSVDRDIADPADCKR